MFMIKAIYIPSSSQLKQARVILDWTQADLAEKTGLSRSAINKIEGKSEADPKIKSLRAIKKAFTTNGIHFVADGINVGVGANAPDSLKSKIVDHLVDSSSISDPEPGDVD